MTPLPLLAALLLAVSAVYTNEQALLCFRGKAMDKCEGPFEECLQEAQCQKQLQMFNTCSFGDTVQDGNHVFNGFCFRRWQDRAHLTQHVITCMAEACDLRYNSELGVKEMVRCAQWMMFDAKIDCEDACTDQMEAKVKDHFYDQPFSALYAQHFENEQASHFAYVMLTECVGEGRGRKMIMEEERMDEEEQQRIQNRTIQLSGEENYRYDEAGL